MSVGLFLSNRSPDARPWLFWLLLISLCCLTYVTWLAVVGFLVLACINHKVDALSCRLNFCLKKDRVIVFSLAGLILFVGVLHFSWPAWWGAFNYFPFVLAVLIFLYSPVFFKYRDELAFGFLMAQLPLFLLVIYLVYFSGGHGWIYSLFVYGHHSSMNPFFVNKNNLAIFVSTVVLMAFNSLLVRSYSFCQKCCLFAVITVGAVNIMILTSRNAVVSLVLAFLVQLFLLYKKRDNSRSLLIWGVVGFVALLSIGLAVFKVRERGVIFSMGKGDAEIAMLKQQKQLAIQHFQNAARQLSDSRHQPLQISLDSLARSSGFKSFYDFKSYKVQLISPSQEVRLYIWAFALKHALDHPFIGWGWQSFSFNYLHSAEFKKGNFLAHRVYHQGFDNSIHHPHQLYLTWLYEGGCGVLACYLLFIVNALRRGWQSPFRAQFLSPLCLLLFSGFFDNLFFDPRINLIFILLIAWTYGEVYIFHESADRHAKKNS